MFLLTDHYPPFSLDDVDYPARPILPERGPLNRVSVFFRSSWPSRRPSSTRSSSTG